MENKNIAKSACIFIKTQFLLRFQQKFDKFCWKYVTNHSVIHTEVINQSPKDTQNTFQYLVDPLELILGSKNNSFQVHFSDCLPMWFLAIFSVGSWGTPTFLTFPDLSIPRRLTRFNLVTGTIFWYFWRGIIQPQLTVPYFDRFTTFHNTYNWGKRKILHPQ